MPRIPSAIDFGQAPTPINKRGVTVDESGVVIGEAIAESGARVYRHAKIQQEKNDGLRYQAAKSALLHSHVKVSRELEEIDDYTTWQKEYENRMVKEVEGATTKIIDEADRALFSVEASTDVLLGAEKIREQAKAREIKDDQDGLESMLEDNLNAAMETEDPDLRERFVVASKEAIKGALEKGSIDKGQADYLDDKWTHDMALGLLIVMEPDARAKVLANPKGTPAELLSKPEREVMLRQAQAENKETRMRAASQAETDRIMTEFQEDPAGAMAAARKITDPDVRAYTENEVGQRLQQSGMIEAEANADRFKAVGDLIESGVAIKDIDTALWMGLSTNERQEMELRREQVLTGEEPIHDDKKYYEWTLLSIDEQEAQDLAHWRPYFDNPHYEAAVARQQAIRDAREGGKEGKAYLTQAATLNERIENALLGGTSPLFKKKPSAQNTAGMKRWATIEATIQKRVEEDSVAKGRKLEPLEIQQHVDDVTMDQYFTEKGFPDPDEKLGFEMTEAEKREAYVPYDEIPEFQRKRLENYAKSLGLNPDEETIGKAYAAGRLQLGNERINEILAGE